jgi:hypothetical protein
MQAHAIVHGDHAAGVGSLNPLGMLFHVFYGLASSVTRMVGLTPLQLGLGLAGALVVGLLVQLVLVSREHGGWHLHDLRGDQDAQQQIAAEQAKG